MKKITPLPWQAEIAPEHTWIRAENGHLVCDVQDHSKDREEANAKFIAQACNNHKPLLESLKGLLKQVKQVPGLSSAGAILLLEAAKSAEQTITKAEEPWKSQ
jgi:hypothetical protein